jgi:NADPH:quinone reductase-like Zn-dependent oxidoreductase
MCFSSKEDFTKSDETYDIIFDAVGKVSFSSFERLPTEHGVCLAAVMEPVPGGWISMTNGHRIVHGSADATAEDLVTLKELIEAQEIKPVIDRKYQLDDIVEAPRYVDTGRKKGNVAITI